jgi:hypothetical protein
MVTRIKSNNITAGSITADLLSATAITDKLGYTPANANNNISADQYARDTANSAGINANTGINNAASASLYANDALSLTQSAFDQGNSTATVANTDYTTVSTTAGTYGNTTTIPVITIAANGRITSVTNTAITGGEGGGGTVSISNETSDTNIFFPVFANSTTGNVSTIFTSNNKFLYKPSTGDLFAEQVNADNGLFVNRTTIENSYTIDVGFSAMSTGPITVANGATITVSANSKWTII